MEKKLLVDEQVLINPGGNAVIFTRVACV